MTGAARLATRIDDRVAANRVLAAQRVLDGFGPMGARDPRRPDR